MSRTLSLPALPATAPSATNPTPQPGCGYAYQCPPHSATPSPSVSPSHTRAPSKSPTPHTSVSVSTPPSLPKTGNHTGLIVGIAVVLILAGVVAFFVSRHRRGPARPV